MIQELSWWVVFVSTFLILASAAILLWSKSYDEGLLGHVGLSILIFGCVITLSGICFGDVEYSFLPESMITRLGGSIFLASVVLRHKGWFCKERRSHVRVEPVTIKAGARVEEEAMCRHS